MRRCDDVLYVLLIYFGGMKMEQKGAILQRDKETYAIVSRVPAGLLSPEVLENMARVSRKYNVPAVKITSAQRIAFIGLKSEDVPRAVQDLGEIGFAEGPCLHYVQACPGNSFCKFGQQDSLGFARKIETLYSGQEGIIPGKTKIGISGCRLSCAESYLRDFGAFATRDGWTILAGGNSGGRPRIGEVLVKDLSEDDALSFLKRCFVAYSSLAKPRERMPRVIERIGIEEFKKSVESEG
jgi:NAD(P)H-nitrite reductase large subunit